MLGGDAGREVPITDGKLEKHLGPRLRKALMINTTIDQPGNLFEIGRKNAAFQITGGEKGYL